jgi:hypothetical protein
MVTMDQHAIDALLGAWSWVEVVGEYVVPAVGSAAMHDNLFTREVGVPKWWSYVDDRLRRELRSQFFRRHDPLQQRQAQCKEACVGRSHHHRLHPEGRLSGMEGECRQVLLPQPLESFLPQPFELVAEAFTKPRLVRRQFIGNEHAVRIAATHVRFRVIHHDAVAYARHRRFDQPPAGWQFIGDLEVVAVHPVARCLYQIGGRTRPTYLPRLAQ